MSLEQAIFYVEKYASFLDVNNIELGVDMLNIIIKSMKQAKIKTKKMEERKKDKRTFWNALLHLFQVNQTKILLLLP